MGADIDYCHRLGFLNPKNTIDFLPANFVIQLLIKKWNCIS